MPLAPQKINNYIVIDFETGGADKEGHHSKKYPITEFGGMVLDGVTLKKIVSYDNFVKPYDDNLIYDPQAAKITGITREMCEEKGVSLKQLVQDLCLFFKEANTYNARTAKPILIGHNLPFDSQFLQDIFGREGEDLKDYLDGDYDCYGSFIPTGIDTKMIAKMCWGDITETTTNFRLTSCCERAGIEYIDGHHAMNDVAMTADLWAYFVQRMRSRQILLSQDNKSNHRLTFEWGG